MRRGGGTRIGRPAVCPLALLPALSPVGQREFGAVAALRAERTQQGAEESANDAAGAVGELDVGGEGALLVVVGTVAVLSGMSRLGDLYPPAAELGGADGRGPAAAVADLVRDQTHERDELVGEADRAFVMEYLFSADMARCGEVRLVADISQGSVAISVRSRVSAALDVARRRRCSSRTWASVRWLLVLSPRAGY